MSMPAPVIPSFCPWAVSIYTPLNRGLVALEEDAVVLRQLQSPEQVTDSESDEEAVGRRVRR